MNISSGFPVFQGNVVLTGLIEKNTSSLLLDGFL